VTVNATPYTVLVQMNANLGLYAQWNQWTIKRLTLTWAAGSTTSTPACPKYTCRRRFSWAHAIRGSTRRADWKDFSTATGRGL